MNIEITIPSPGESIKEVTLAKWLITNGDFVTKNQEIAEIESEKATLPLIAAESGKVSIKIEAGQTVAPGMVACSIYTLAENTKAVLKNQVETDSPKKNEPEKKTTEKVIEGENSTHTKTKITPLAKQVMKEHQLSADEVVSGMKKIQKQDVINVIDQKTPLENMETRGVKRETTTQKMSPLRKKLSERLVTVKNQTAMLTTFNEVDMSKIMEMRTRYNEAFQTKYGTKIGFISVFIKACAIALKQYPEVNAMIDDENIIYHHFADIGIAVQSPKGLLVPVIRNTEDMKIFEIEQKIKELGIKAQSNKIGIDELIGGTFTITNGGTFGSLLSTPILNPPQSGILGMHKIQDRPVAIQGKVEIRPMMYVALSYDHRLVDGKGAVSFLVKIKELIENPVNLIFDGQDPLALLLGV